LISLPTADSVYRISTRLNAPVVAHTGIYEVAALLEGGEIGLGNSCGIPDNANQLQN
jgi:hypothetical protein